MGFWRMIGAMPAWLTKLETLLLGAAVLLIAGAGIAFGSFQTTTLTIAVAQRDGTEPELIQAYADLLGRGGENIRLKILSFTEVNESAEALKDGQADLAVVGPDVALPGTA